MTKEGLEKEARKYADLRIPRVEMPIRNSELVKAYLSSAEPREKRIAELEAYNKKLLQSDIDKQNKIVLLSQKVNDLQKENAELKEQLRLAREMPYSAVKKFAEEKTQEQLTKAKKNNKKFFRCVYRRPYWRSRAIFKR